MNKAILTEVDYATMEKDIVVLVRALNDVGIFTKSSCGGHISGPDYHPYPYVLIDYRKTDPQLIAELIEVIAKHNIDHLAMLNVFCLQPMFAMIYGETGLFMYLQPKYENEDGVDWHLEFMRKATLVLAKAIRERMKQITAP